MEGRNRELPLTVNDRNTIPSRLNSQCSNLQAQQRLAPKPPSKSLYVSHFISTWNSRGFEFGAVLFLAAIYPGTLLPMSIYALTRAAAGIAFSPLVGRFIDSQDRLKVIRFSILGQRLSVVLSCVLFLHYLLLDFDPKSLIGIVDFLALIALACSEKACSIMNTVAVERDWVVVIAGEDESELQLMNSQMRRIDLFCKLVSPLAIALLDGFSTTIAVLVTLGMNGATSVAEYLLIAWVHSQTPALARDMEQTLDDEDQRPSNQDWIGSVLISLKLYAKSHAFLPSFSLSILYLTVLSFSGQMITYLLSLESPRFSSAHIGMIRTISAALEISSTFIAPRLINRLGAVRTGIWCLSWQFLCLSPGVASFWLPLNGSVVRTTIFITSVVLSRVGLWSYDLTAQLLVQNSIGASQRGSFSSVEASLQNFFELCAFSLTIVWSRPDQFKYPATVSLIAIYVAAALYARFVRVRRGHLLHLPECCKGVTRYHGEGELDEDEAVELLESGGSAA